MTSYTVTVPQGVCTDQFTYEDLHLEVNLWNSPSSYENPIICDKNEVYNIFKVHLCCR